MAKIGFGLAGVRGLWLAAEKCEFGDVYNLGATQIYAIQDVIETIQAQVKVPFTVETDQALVRGCDEPVIAGNINKFQQRTGWAPQVDLSDTIQDMLDWWRDRLSASTACDYSLVAPQTSELRA